VTKEVVGPNQRTSLSSSCLFFFFSISAENSAAAMANPNYIRLSEVAKHTTEDDLWFVKDRKVYDITKFVDQHPGGADTLLGVAGKDGTSDFDAVGHSDSAVQDLSKYYIGDIHPDDADKIPQASIKPANNYFGIAVIVIVAAVCAFFIFKP
jgi:cytochrome b5